MAEITEVPPPRKRKNPTRELIETLVLAVVIALVVRTFIVETYRVDGSSMEATLHHGERVLVNKFLYDFIRPPRPGDIIVFQYPKQPEKDFIKRVVAGPGDTVELREGKVYVNGKLFPEAPTALLSGEKVEPTEVKADTVWVLGDNRNNSEDSRSFGEVPYKNIRGLAFFRIWPLSRICSFANPADLAAGQEKGFLACQ